MIFVPICILLLLEVTVSIDLFSHRDEGSFITLKHSKHKSFFVYNHTKYTWPDKYTIFSYGFNPYYKFTELPFGERLRHPKELNSSELMMFGDGGEITSLWNNHRNDAVLSKQTARTNLVKETTKLLNCRNGGVLYRNFYKDWIIGDNEKVISIDSANRTSLQENLSSAIAFMPEYYSNKSYFTNSTIALSMTDPRLFEFSNGRLFVVFCRHNKAGRIIVVHAEIFTENRQDLIGRRRISIRDTIFTTFEGKDQKNWTPFESNNKLYFIVSIWPFHVVEIIPDVHNSWIGNPKPIAFQNLDITSCMRWQWSKYDVILRGGTQALQIAKNTYFSIFHSSNNVSNADYGVLQTYFMGAYTFVVDDRENPSMRLTGLSSEPIAHESWYNGSWSYQPHAYGMFDYIVFPMSIIVEGDDLFIIFGKQDSETWICRLKLSEVLSSLIPVHKNGTCV